MSWELMRSETETCGCGQGTITYTFEMDDWNRGRKGKEIHCPACFEKEAQKQATQHAKEEQEKVLYSKAREIAVERYLDRWLSLYSGLTKKTVWKLYTGGSDYPALGTFYKHVKDFGGVGEYMRWCFSNHFEKALQTLAIKDTEIDALLAERERLRGE